MVDSGLDEDEGNALKNKRGLRPISAVQQVAEWELGARMVDAGRPRRVWLPTCHSPLPSAGDVTSLPIPLCRQSGCSPTYAEGTVLGETCALDANIKLRVWCGCGPQETSAKCEAVRELAAATHTAQGRVIV